MYRDLTKFVPQVADRSRPRPVGSHPLGSDAKARAALEHAAQAAQADLSPLGMTPHFHVAGHAIRAQVETCRLPGCDSPRAYGLGGSCSEVCGERHYEFMRDAEAER